MSQLPVDPGDLLRLMDREAVRQVIHLERKQMVEEGFACGPEPLASHSDLISAYRDLLASPPDRDFRYLEPESLAGIRAARPAGPRRSGLVLPPEGLYDRIYGGWLGRTAGCVLGKPVEIWGDRKMIVHYLSQAGGIPLCNYIPRLDPLPDGFRFSPAADGTFLGEIDGAPPDDDTDYTVLALHIVETHGLEFTTADIAAEWLDHLAYARTFTAERAAYRNLIAGIPPEKAGGLLNPWREFIGARIRADLYGWIAPGQPELAAGLAFRDAILSHTRNGVYAAMFVAAMLAWCFVTADIEEIIRVGLSEIPADCRLAQAVRDVLAERQASQDWEVALEQLEPKVTAYDPIHAINNTAWMTLSMSYSGGDFEKAICTAVLCGLDTDCNAANAGAVLGTLTGASGLPLKWTDPLRDTLFTSLVQLQTQRLSDLARRTAGLAERTLATISEKRSVQ